MTTRKPPTVPIYVRIPADLRARLDAAVGNKARPWLTVRLQDLVIEALYAAYPDPPPPDEPEPTAPPVTRARKRRGQPAA